MLRRVFFAINPPSFVVKELLLWKNEFSDFLTHGVKWARKENLHITVDFVGAIREKKLSELISLVDEFNYPSFKVELNKISYFPPQKKDAKMIWAIGRSEKLKKMSVALRKIRESGDLQEEFIPHITLGRIKKWEFRKIDFNEIPEINEDINLGFSVKSFDLMESKMKRGEIVYEKIKTFYLQDNGK